MSAVQPNFVLLIVTTLRSLIAAYPVVVNGGPSIRDAALRTACGLTADSPAASTESFQRALQYLVADGIIRKQVVYRLAGCGPNTMRYSFVTAVAAPRTSAQAGPAS